MHAHNMSADCSFFSRCPLSAGLSKSLCWEAQRANSLMRLDIVAHLRGHAAAAGAAGGRAGAARGAAVAASAPGQSGRVRGLGEAQGTKSLQWHQAVHRMGHRHHQKPPSLLPGVRGPGEETSREQMKWMIMRGEQELRGKRGGSRWLGGCCGLQRHQSIDGPFAAVSGTPGRPWVRKTGAQRRAAAMYMIPTFCEHADRA